MPPRKKKKTEPATVGLAAGELTKASPPAAVKELIARVEKSGGTALASYREPYGGHWLVLAGLPIDQIEPTPFQRELSDTHAKRLETVIPKVERFLDPLIAVPSESGFWTPNGMHRLEAMRRLGARSVVVLLVPEREIAFRILALNTEKAHNVKDKSLEVVRMVDALVADPETAERPESDWAFEFEEPAYLTIGRCYEEKPRYSGGTYMSVVRRLEEFSDDPIATAAERHKEHAARLLELDKVVDRCVKELKDAGLQSSYLKPFVVARINPLRFVKPARGGKGAAVDFDETIDKMMAKAEKFDAAKIKPQDLARAAGGAPTE